VKKNLAQFFQNRTIAIATMHQKERALAPFLENRLGLKYIVPEQFNTDLFGTFSGEIARSDSQVETARMKCLQAMKLTGLDIGIASEGSFGPHPTLFFLPANSETLIFIDKKNNIELVVHECSTETNFSGKKINTEEELIDFAKTIGFPEHGLILRPEQQTYKDQIKGIQSWKQLNMHWQKLAEKYGSIYVETDMRAFVNPTRMNVIAKTAQKLVDIIENQCPSCSWPGFSIESSSAGLLCNRCSLPTKSILANKYLCKNCDFSEDIMYPNGKQTEDPMYCDFCNP
jgi:hypothetical protein